MTVAFTRSVQPSGLALITATVPMFPVAPGRFSMMTLFFSSVLDPLADTRAPTSVAPPAG